MAEPINIGDEVTCVLSNDVVKTGYIHKVIRKDICFANSLSAIDGQPCVGRQDCEGYTYYIKNKELGVYHNMCYLWLKKI